MTSWQRLQDKMHKYLCPPGHGVHTVHTAKELKSSLLRRLYATDVDEQVKQLWREGLSHLPQETRPLLLGLCSDTGGGILRGANWGPLFIRQALLADLQEHKALPFCDLGDVRVIPHLLLDDHLNAAFIEKCRAGLYQDPKSPLPVSPLSIAQDFLRDLYQIFPEKKVLGLGGDHSVSYPLVSEYLKAKKRAQKRVAVLHFDAHTDLLAERLGVDICFGSWAYHILKDLPSPAHLIQIGIRASGRPKEHWEQSLGVQQVWAQEVRQQGASAIAEGILQSLQRQAVDEIYVSFDIDALDAQYAPSTGTPEIEGLLPHEALLILQTVCEEVPLTGADLVEVAPFTYPPLSQAHAQGNQQAGQNATLSSAQAIGHYFLEALAPSERELQA